MSRRKLNDLLRAGEGPTVEFKESFDSAAIETLCAFANAAGGSVLIGVGDDGSVRGCTVGKETLSSWINQAKQVTSPVVIPDAEAHTVAGRTVVELSVTQFPIKPVACRGRYYRRVGKANHQLTVNEVVEMHLRSFNTSWDYQPCAQRDIADISMEKVRRFVTLANRLGNEPIEDGPEDVLAKLELVRQGRITNAGYLLFAAGEPAVTTVELGRFQDPVTVKDGARVKADLFTEVDEILAFIRKHINRRYVITGRAQRDEVWEYPLSALREIVTNAVVHRDYTAASDTVVKICDDRIECYNPGRLPAGITVRDLLRGDYISTPRNRQVADIFKAAGLIEKYGSGIRRVLQAFRDAGAPPPTFREMGEGFMVTAYAADGRTPQKTPQKSGLAETLLQAVRANPTATRNDFARTLGLGPETVKEYLAKLKAAGRIRRIGSDRKGSWEAVGKPGRKARSEVR